MPETKPAAYRRQWDALTQEAAALAAEGKERHGLVPNPRVAEQEARAAAISVSQEAVAHAAWEATARDMADVLLLAELTWWHWWGVGTFPQLPADIQERDEREVAVAQLVVGVFDASIAQGHTGGTQP